MKRLDQVWTELDNYAQFEGLIADYVEINEALSMSTRLGPTMAG